MTYTYEIGPNVLCYIVLFYTLEHKLFILSRNIEMF